jgi:hypothetical protein
MSRGRRINRDTLLLIGGVSFIMISMAAILWYTPDHVADRKNIIEGFLVNFIWTIFVLLVAYSGGLYPYFKERRRLFKFFGIHNETPNVSIFVSNMFIKPSGTLALERTTNGYTGRSISLLEYDVALALQAELSQKPIIGIPGKLQDAIGQQVFDIKKTRVTVSVSPRWLPDQHEIPQMVAEGDYDEHWKKTRDRMESLVHQDDTVVIIGSSIYNSLSKWYLDNFFPQKDSGYDSRFWFGKKDDTRLMYWMQPPHGIQPSHEPQELRPNTDGTREPGLILKFKHGQKTVLVCAGISGWATASTALFLLDYWHVLSETIEEQSFGIVVSCFRPTDFNIDLSDMKEAEYDFVTSLSSKDDAITDRILKNALASASRNRKRRPQ